VLIITTGLRVMYSVLAQYSLCGGFFDLFYHNSLHYLLNLFKLRKSLTQFQQTKAIFIKQKNNRKKHKHV